MGGGPVDDSLRGSSKIVPQGGTERDQIINRTQVNTLDSLKAYMLTMFVDMPRAGRRLCSC